MHLLRRQGRGRVLHHRDLVAELSAVAHRGLDARIRQQSDGDELMNAVLLELQVQVRVGEAAGAPMLVPYDVPRLRFGFLADLAAPRPVCEGLDRPGALLRRGDVLPRLVVAGAVPAVQGIEDPDSSLPRRRQHLQHVRNAAIGFRKRLQAIPYLSAFGNEIIVGIDHQEPGELPVVCHVRHGCLARAQSTSVMSGFPFSTTYVASSAPRPVPTFFAEWIVPAGMNSTSPALSVTGGLPST